MEDLKLVEDITRFYSGNKIRAIKACIDSLDTPISVRCAGLHGKIANTAYLDMMRRTHRQFEARDVFKSFRPELQLNGQALGYLKLYKETYARGGGDFGLPLWNLKDVLYLKSSTAVIGGLVVTGFEPTSKLRVALPGKYLADLQFPRIRGIGERKAG